MRAKLKWRRGGLVLCPPGREAAGRVAPSRYPMWASPITYWDFPIIQRGLPLGLHAPCPSHPCSVQFTGEEGVDAGGVTREWYQVGGDGMRDGA